MSLERPQTFDRPESDSASDRQTIAELRRANLDLTEANTQLAEAVAARDTFLAIAAHELRNPMTPIVGRIQMLRSMMRRPDFKPEKIEQGLDQIDWLISLYVKRANTLLDVSRVTTGMLRLDLAPLDVCGLAREVADSFKPIADHAGSALMLELPEDPLEVIGDRLAVEQILDNLVSNAIKYGAGQPIALSAVASTKDGVAIIYVRDGGPGISAENQARIFERFERDAAGPGGQRLRGGFVDRAPIDRSDGWWRGSQQQPRRRFGLSGNPSPSVD